MMNQGSSAAKKGIKRGDQLLEVFGISWKGWQHGIEVAHAIFTARLGLPGPVPKNWFLKSKNLSYLGIFTLIEKKKTYLSISLNDTKKNIQVNGENFLQAMSLDRATRNKNDIITIVD